MDRKTQLTPVASSIHTPAYLWLGSPQGTLQHTKTFLQKKLCTRNGCGHCISCVQIEQEQHHSLMWLMPDKQYTIDQLSPIFDKIALTLNGDEHYFFIIKRADFLTPLCANRLLKALEEPPKGYSFILLAQRKDSLIPTIRSRCLIQKITMPDATTDIIHKKLFSACTEPAIDPLFFLQALEESKINERESNELFDVVFSFWLEKATAINHPIDKGIYSCANSIVDLLKYEFNRLPMPGSSKIFWRNIFLKIQTLFNNNKKS